MCIILSKVYKAICAYEFTPSDETLGTARAFEEEDVLFLLTGEPQTGKTRWLMQLIGELETQSMRVEGVVAPGRWIDHGKNAQLKERYEKIGIDNLLLPEREVIAFAERRDLAEGDGTFDSSSQAAQAGLGWAIHDDAIARVNAHFEKLRSANAPACDLIVVDELGILELEHGEGLAQAASLIDRGASTAAHHALIVVRPSLVEKARKRFSSAPWDGMRVIRPDHAAASLLAQTIG